MSKNKYENHRSLSNFGSQVKPILRLYRRRAQNSLFWGIPKKGLFLAILAFWAKMAIFGILVILVYFPLYGKNGNFGYFVIFGVFVKNVVFWYFCEKCKNDDFRRSYKNRYFFKNGVFYKSMKFGVFKKMVKNVIFLEIQ